MFKRLLKRLCSFMSIPCLESTVIPPDPVNLLTLACTNIGTTSMQVNATTDVPTTCRFVALATVVPSDIVNSPEDLTGTQTNHSTTITGLTPDRTYEIQKQTTMNGGTSWENLGEPITCVTIPEQATGTVTIQQCGTTLTSSNLDVSWVDTQPAPASARNYDLFLRIGAGGQWVDQGFSQVYPATSWPTIQVPTNGQEIAKRIYWWDDGNIPGLGADGLPATSNFTECTCTAFTNTNQNHVSYAGIEANKIPEYCLTKDEHYLAEAIRQNPGQCYPRLDTQARCVFFDPDPGEPNGVINITSAGQLINAMNTQSNAVLDGNGQTFALPMGSNINNSNTLKNMTLVSSANSGLIFINVNGSNVIFKNVTVDMQNKQISNALRIFGEGFQFVNSVVENIRYTGGITVDGINMKAGNALITCSTFRNITSQNTPARGIRFQGATKAGSDVFGNYFENIQAKNTTSGGTDGDSVVVQQFTFTSKARFHGNRGINMGKRLMKFQGAGNLNAYSNFAHFRDANGPLGYRNKRNGIAQQLGTNVDVSNNYTRSDYTGSRQESMGYTTNGRQNVIMDCNVFEVNHDDPGFDYGIMAFPRDGGNDYHPSASIQGNVFKGTGRLRSAYWDRETPNNNNFASMGGNFNLGTIAVPLNSTQIRNN